MLAGHGRHTLIGISVWKCPFYWFKYTSILFTLKDWWWPADRNIWATSFLSSAVEQAKMYVICGYARGPLRGQWIQIYNEYCIHCRGQGIRSWQSPTPFSEGLSSLLWSLLYWPGRYSNKISRRSIWILTYLKWKSVNSWLLSCM